MAFRAALRVMMFLRPALAATSQQQHSRRRRRLSFAQEKTEAKTLESQEDHERDSFGFDVAVDGTLGIVSAVAYDADGAEGAEGDWLPGQDRGAVYTFEYNNAPSSGGEGWEIDEETPLMSQNDDTTASYEHFGESVDVYQGSSTTTSRLAVGSLWGDEGGVDHGSVYVYDKKDDDGAWTLLNGEPLGGPAPQSFFGFSVAIHGTNLVVGAPGSANDGLPDDYEPAAYFYRTQGSRFFLVDSFNGDSGIVYGYGRQVALTATWAAVADDKDSDSRGAVFVYYTENEGSSWKEGPKLTLGSSGTSAFGRNVAASGNVLAVVAWESGATDGRIYTFATNDGGATWQQQPGSVISAPNAGIAFPYWIAMDESVLVASAWGEGAVYVYSTDDDGASWSEFAKLTASDEATGQSLGFKVDVSGRFVLASALPRGSDVYAATSSVYAFELDLPTDDDGDGGGGGGSTQNMWVWLGPVVAAIGLGVLGGFFGRVGEKLYKVCCGDCCCCTKKKSADDSGKKTSDDAP